MDTLVALQTSIGRRAFASIYCGKKAQAEAEIKKPLALKNWPLAWLLKILGLVAGLPFALSLGKGNVA